MGREECAQVTPHGQIAFFAEWPATVGVFDRRVQLWHATPLWECGVVATNAQYDIATMAPLCRDRCDGENGCADWRNPWGWGRITLQDMHPSELIIGHTKAAAQPWPKLNRWTALLACIGPRIVGQISQHTPPSTLPASG